jgi:general secretion pathway protein G
MIELIFVIVIIGILAAVAIPKLAATRDDAKSVKAVQNLATCISDIGAAFTGSGIETSGIQTDGSDGFASCKAVKNEKCFNVLGVAHTASISDGNITVKDATNNATWCKTAQATALTQDLSSSAGKVHSFGGSKVTY